MKPDHVIVIEDEDYTKALAHGNRISDIVRDWAQWWTEEPIRLNRDGVAESVELLRMGHDLRARLGSETKVSGVSAGGGVLEISTLDSGSYHKVLRMVHDGDSFRLGGHVDRVSVGELPDDPRQKKNPCPTCGHVK